MNLAAVLDAQHAWQASIAAGPQAAKQSALAALAKCGNSVSALAINLKRIGYPLVQIVEPSTELLDTRISRIESVIGASVPPVIVEFWRRIGGLSLVDLDRYSHSAFWNKHGINGAKGYCDGLHIYGCTLSWANFVCSEFDQQQEYEPYAKTPFLMALSPDGYHKDCISGGEAYGVHPGNSWAPVWQNFEWSGLRRPVTANPGPPDFLAYLRTAILECAGFPGLLGCPAFEALRERLLEGVAPF